LRLASQVFFQGVNGFQQAKHFPDFIKSAKMTTLLSRFKHIILQHRYILQKAAVLLKLSKANFPGFFISTAKI